MHFYDVYSGPHLWKLIPREVRRYWVDAIQDVFNDSRTKVYKGCTVDEPAPYFVDRTSEIDSFWDDIKSYELKRWLEALSFDPLQLGNPWRKESIMLSNVLCLWGCLEICFRSEKINLGILIQRHLAKVQLNFPFSDWYRSVIGPVLSQVIGPSGDGQTIPTWFPRATNTFQKFS